MSLDGNTQNLTKQRFELRIPSGFTTTQGQKVHVCLTPGANGIIAGTASLRDVDDEDKKLCEVEIVLVDR